MSDNENDAASSSSNTDNYSLASSFSSDSDEDVNAHLKKKRKWKLCTKLTLPEHLAAYMEGRQLDRIIEPIECSKDIIENIFSNYVIVKNILSHLRWQEKLICNDVCPLWNSAVNRLQNEQLGPVDFSVNLGFRTVKKGLNLQKSTEFYTEPMVIFAFYNTVALNGCTFRCKAIEPSACSPSCNNSHCLIDIIYQETTAPRDCMYGIKAFTMSYFPLQHSITMENTIRRPPQGSDAFFCGIFIPKIPGMEFKIINIDCANGIQNVLKPEIKKLTANYIVKGVIACLTDNYLLYVDEENAECLEFLHGMQPNIPFAFGGCLVEDTANKAQDLVGAVERVNKGMEFISGNIMSVGLFVTPKEDNDGASSSLTIAVPKHNFEAYSFVLESAEWSKLQIQQAIQEFSERVPRYEHSVALKFSCMGRQHKHEPEQNSFRTYFPRTRLAGCFGNGELGINHPKRQPRAPNKRAKDDMRYEKVHSYSTVFFYIGWGKVTEEAERDD